MTAYQHLEAMPRVKVPRVYKATLKLWGMSLLFSWLTCNQRQQQEGVMCVSYKVALLVRLDHSQRHWSVRGSLVAGAKPTLETSSCL